MFKGSRQLALFRFERLERKLSKDKDLYDVYKQFMQEYEEMGHMSLTKAPGVLLYTSSCGPQIRRRIIKVTSGV